MWGMQSPHHGSDCILGQRMVFRYKFCGQKFGDSYFVESTGNYMQHFTASYFRCQNPPSLCCPQQTWNLPYRGESNETPSLLGNPREMRSLFRERGGRGSYLRKSSLEGCFYTVIFLNTTPHPVLQIPSALPAGPPSHEHSPLHGSLRPSCAQAPVLRHVPWRPLPGGGLGADDDPVHFF